MDETQQPTRVLVGHCPECGRVCVVENDYRSWPLVHCACGWTGATTGVRNGHLYERDGVLRTVGIDVAL